MIQTPRTANSVSEYRVGSLIPVLCLQGTRFSKEEVQCRSVWNGFHDARRREEDDGFPLALGLPLLSALSVLVEVGAAEVWLVVLEVDDEDEVEVVDVLVDSGTRVLSGRSADKS